jgi:SAM-dependent methyltransferase
VIAVTDPSAEAPYDFVMCCHLLEHVAEPAALTAELAKLIAPDGLIYFEVPWEPYFFRRVLQRFGRRDWVPPPLHEHITFFTTRALRTLVARAGLSVLACSLHRIDLDGTTLRVISLFAAPLAIADRKHRTLLDWTAEFARWFIVEASKKIGALIESSRLALSIKGRHH